ncbi:MAG TPA: DUF202 domain-containing protein [Nocardioidaceae bacterium]|jgi:putative membrane protein
MSEPAQSDDEQSTTTTDPRFQLANERTLLSWLRLSLGLLAGAVAVSSPVSRLGHATRAVLGLWLVAISALAATVGWVRWQRTTRALERGTPIPETSAVRWVAVGWGITIVGVAVAVAIETII